MLTLGMMYQSEMDEVKFWLEPISCVMPLDDGSDNPQHINFSENPAHRLNDVATEPLSITCRIGYVHDNAFKDMYGDFQRAATIANYSSMSIRLPPICYLALHSECAGAAHFSGGGPLVEQLLRDHEERVSDPCADRRWIRLGSPQHWTL